MDDHEVEVVYDVKLAFQSGKLYAAEVDFSHYRALRRLGLNKLARILADRHKEDRVSWLYVQPLPEQLGSFAGNVKLKVPKAGIERNSSGRSGGHSRGAGGRPARRAVQFDSKPNMPPIRSRKWSRACSAS